MATRSTRCTATSTRYRPSLARWSLCRFSPECFWAAPLVSGEYEAGTHRLAWTQSVSPLRWISIKIALVFGFAAGFAVVLGVLATWTLDPLTDAFGGRYNRTWYHIMARSRSPAGCSRSPLGLQPGPSFAALSPR